MRLLHETTYYSIYLKNRYIDQLVLFYSSLTDNDLNDCKQVLLVVIKFDNNTDIDCRIQTRGGQHMTRQKILSEPRLNFR